MNNDWVSVSDASQALGISERAIQKRCKAGKLRAELVTTESGTQWQIAATEIARTSEPGSRTDEPPELKGSRTNELFREPNEPGDEPSSRTDEPTFEHESTQTGELTNQKVREPANQFANLPNLTNEPTNQVREPNEPDDEPSSRTSSPDMMAHLMEENRFLRGVVESQARDAAELRAALREALKISSRALNEGVAKPVEIDGNSSAQVLAADKRDAAQAGELGPLDGALEKATAARDVTKRPQLAAWQRVAARILGIR